MYFWLAGGATAGGTILPSMVDVRVFFSRGKTTYLGVKLEEPRRATGKVRGVRR